MIGISVTGPCFIYGDNQSVLTNVSIPESKLKKKSNQITYDFVCEGVACNERRTTYINTNENRSDLLTKVIPASAKQDKFVSEILMHVGSIFCQIIGQKQKSKK